MIRYLKHYIINKYKRPGALSRQQGKRIKILLEEGFAVFEYS
jgi:hypothetical protein